MKKRLVIILVIVIILLIAGWDTYLYLDNVPGNTISQIVRAHSIHPYLPFGLGCFMGWLVTHFWDDFK